MRRKQAVLSAITTCRPATTLTNDEMARSCPPWSAERIRRATGIRARGIATAAECASDLGVTAAQRIFDTGICKPSDVDFLLFCTQTPDYLLPSSSCLIQDRLGLSTRCGAFDVNQGCSGFVYSLATAKGLIESEAATCVLVITAETYSKILRPEDASTRILFGDGAAAALVTTATDDVTWMGPFVFGTDGSHAPDIIVRNGGMRGVDSPSLATLGDRYLFMDGLKVFNFMTETIPSVVQDLLHRCHLTIDDVHHFVFHQASKVILEHLRDRIGIPPDRFSVHLEESGNTGSSSIPAALLHAVDQGVVKYGDTVMLVAYGTGYSWGAALVKNALGGSP